MFNLKLFYFKKRILLSHQKEEIIIYSSVHWLWCTDYRSTLPGARMHRIDSRKAEILHLLTEELSNPRR